MGDDIYVVLFSFKNFIYSSLTQNVLIASPSPSSPLTSPPPLLFSPPRPPTSSISLQKTAGLPRVFNQRRHTRCYKTRNKLLYQGWINQLNWSKMVPQTEKKKKKESETLQLSLVEVPQAKETKHICILSTGPCRLCDFSSVSISPYESCLVDFVGHVLLPSTTNF